VEGNKKEGGEAIWTQGRRIFFFPQQQWSRECVSLLLYTYIAYVLSWMVASILQVQAALNFCTNAFAVHWGFSKYLFLPHS